jgi:hypothetical protein
LTRFVFPKKLIISNGQEGDKRWVVKLIEKEDNKILRIPFFSLSLLPNRRPNLGLLGPDTVLHFREKGLRRILMISLLPFTSNGKRYNVPHVRMNACYVSN